MHELSLAAEVIRLAEKEAAGNGASVIREITIEIGALSGVEADAFQFGLELLVKGTLLGQAALDLVRIPGSGRCNSCDREFEMETRLSACPQCGCMPSLITGGQEFRVLSMIIE
jgi:hydrogenase nickel incorporation protein HypA/HybF